MGEVSELFQKFSRVDLTLSSADTVTDGRTKARNWCRIKDLFGSLFGFPDGPAVWS